jgi:hypothetical protein
MNKAVQLILIVTMFALCLLAYGGDLLPADVDEAALAAQRDGEEAVSALRRLARQQMGPRARKTTALADSIEAAARKIESMRQRARAGEAPPGDTEARIRAEREAAADNLVTSCVISIGTAAQSAAGFLPPATTAGLRAKEALAHLQVSSKQFEDRWNAFLLSKQAKHKKKGGN